jgi:hypothetical protein
MPARTDATNGMCTVADVIIDKIIRAALSA